MIRTTMCLLLLAANTPVFADEGTVEPGKIAPDFTATALDGKKFKLTDKLQGGKKNVALMFSRAHW